MGSWKQLTAASMAVFSVLAVSACVHPGFNWLREREQRTNLRLAAIARAQVWREVDVRSADMVTGPTGPGSFTPNQTVTCDYVQKKTEGQTPKFTCANGPKDEFKVKYGQANGEVFGEVAATRLLWALGFGADREYPVHVVCRGCPAALAPDAETFGGNRVFEFAAIERKMDGWEMVGPMGEGWSWPELNLVKPEAGGASRAERDALELMAVILQHTDSKAGQQRLMCLDKDADTPSKAERGRGLTPCEHPFMMINDLGNTFGAANQYNRETLSVDLERWSKTAVWKDPRRCVANLHRSVTGTLEDPVISEGGRAFLASLLTQLSDEQMRALFDVARFPDRLVAGKPAAGGAPAAAWAAALRDKIDQVAHRSCPTDRAPAAE